MKSFYIASSLFNKEAVRYVSAKLKQLGYTQTYDWTQNERATSLEALRQIGQAELQAVLEADFFIMLLPARNGSHTEFGMALGRGIPVYLYAPDDQHNQLETTTTFYHLPKVQQVIGTLDELIERVVGDTQ